MLFSEKYLIILFFFIFISNIKAQDKYKQDAIRMRNEAELDYNQTFKINNFREIYFKYTTYKQFKNDSHLENMNLNRVVDTTESTFNEIPNKNSLYRRNTVYTLLTYDSINPNYHVINSFGGLTASEKFNYLNFGPYLINTNKAQNKLQSIQKYLDKENIAKRFIIDWFNQDSKGNFSMKTIAERGLYDASELDKAISKLTIRGNSLLKDAGVELIKNTFVIVFDVEPLLVSEAPTFMAKATFDYKIDMYLFQLKWDDDIAYTFYTQFWTDKTNYYPDRVKAFNETSFFKMEFLGKTEYRKTKKESFQTSKGILFDQLIKEEIKNAWNYLETDYPVLTTKFPLYSESPIGAQVGTKEGIKVGDKFEVLEKFINEDGDIEFKVVGVVNVKYDLLIWDNQKSSEWLELKQKDIEFTVFEGKKGIFKKGMLLRQLYKK